MTDKTMFLVFFKIIPILIYIYIIRINGFLMLSISLLTQFTIIMLSQQASLLLYIPSVFLLGLINFAFFKLKNHHYSKDISEKKGFFYKLQDIFHPTLINFFHYDAIISAKNLIINMAGNSSFLFAVIGSIYLYYYISYFLVSVVASIVIIAMEVKNHSSRINNNIIIFQVSNFAMNLLLLNMFLLNKFMLHSKTLMIFLLISKTIFIGLLIFFIIMPFLNIKIECKYQKYEDKKTLFISLVPFLGTIVFLKNIKISRNIKSDQDEL